VCRGGVLCVSDRNTVCMVCACYVRFEALKYVCVCVWVCVCVCTLCVGVFCDSGQIPCVCKWVFEAWKYGFLAKYPLCVRVCVRGLCVLKVGNSVCVLDRKHSVYSV